MMVKNSTNVKKKEQSLHLTPLNLQKTTNFVVENPCKIHVAAWNRQQNVGLIGSKPYPCLFTSVLSNYHCLTFLFITNGNKIKTQHNDRTLYVSGVSFMTFSFRVIINKK